VIGRRISSDAPLCFTIVVALLVVGTVVTAQPPARDQPPTPPAETGVIRGRVVRADTGEPLRRVQVRVDEWSTKDLSGPAATMTDADGRYELTQLPAGRYHLKARRGGYVEVAYGQRRPFERGRPLELGEAAVLEDIDFALPPGAVVTGHVVDEAGEAVAHVSVSLARRRYIEGGRRLVSESGSSTDDRGEFRIFDVPPGEYVIVARFHTVVELGARDRVRYVPTYYPGTPVAAEAQPVTVGLGQEVPGITIALARVATATVRGVVRSSGQSSTDPFTFVIAREIDGPQAYGETATAVAGRDGAFAVAGLLPGTYVVEARSGSEFASTEVVVDGSDVAGVTLMLSKGVTARGRIRFDTGNPPQDLRPAQVFVMPRLLDHQMASMSEMGMRAGPVVQDDWTFELQGLTGRGFIRAGTLSDWQMKRIRREGVDVTDTPLTFATDIDGLEIELTQRLTTVSGSVSNHDGGVALDATVIVFADDPQKWGPHSRFIQSARPDQQGRFTMRGLPPGAYRAIAVVTWNLERNRIRMCSRPGATLGRVSCCRRARRTLSI
jgi:5-hydroxyisourate hydrolase-like protein (transthyretin family)